MNQGAMKQKEAVEFLVKLAGLGDPANWRQGDLMNIIEDLRRSVEPPAGGKADKEIKRVFRQPMLLRPIIEELRDLVEAAVDGKQLKLRVGPGTVVFDGSRLGERDAVRWDAALRDIMIQDAANDLSDLKSGKLLRCGECRRPLLAVRKGQKYCSQICAIKVAVRNYQKRHRVERAQRERERRQSKKLGLAGSAPM